jgi:hypothetical protein
MTHVSPQSSLGSVPFLIDDMIYIHIPVSLEIFHVDVDVDWFSVSISTCGFGFSILFLTICMSSKYMMSWMDRLVLSTD